MSRTVFGTITNELTGKAIPGLKVVAWDDDDKTEDRMGEAVTDENGAYQILYAGVPLGETQPDIFIKVYKHIFHLSLLLAKSRVYRDQDAASDCRIDLRIAFFEKARSVYGLVTWEDGSPADGATVAAWDDDYPSSHDDYLGSGRVAPRAFALGALARSGRGDFHHPALPSAGVS
ncbi:MAG: carboxypeptidase regulatory-like domain-containing protein [Polyangiaceae bacterium]|nr:carboxypeptidase regulatory-like domain-containing protein [Polyangiaceae bacterium]